MDILNVTQMQEKDTYSCPKCNYVFKNTYDIENETEEFTCDCPKCDTLLVYIVTDKRFEIFTDDICLTRNEFGILVCSINPNDI